MNQKLDDIHNFISELKTKLEDLKIIKITCDTTSFPPPVIQMNYNKFIEIFNRGEYEATMYDRQLDKLSHFTPTALIETYKRVKRPLANLYDINNAALSKQNIKLSDGSVVPAEELIERDGRFLLSELASEKVFVCDKGD